MSQDAVQQETTHHPQASQTPIELPTVQVPAGHLLTGQLQHIMLLALLFPGALYLARPALDGSTWLGLADSTWFAAALGVAIVHQLLVAFVFRTQLVYGLMTRLFGHRDLLIWGILFVPLLLLRPLLILATGLADAGSLTLWPVGQLALGLLLLIPSLYALYSVGRYFGLPRALGGDHFRQRYREMPLVKAGAFKYSDNAMYAIAFLLLWALALLTGSRAALVAALFQHAYIWVHMYCTEEPDMRVLYG